MVSNITIACFDINYDNNRDILEFLGENIFALGCPLRIFDEFLDVNSFIETTKRRKKISEFKYTFQTELFEKKIFLDLYVLYDLSFIHDTSLYADAYLLFINLEKENTLEQLGKITKYILESCCMDKRIYIIGIYKDKIIPNLEKELIEIYLDEQNINYEYYQIKYNINSLIINNKDEKEKNECEKNLRKKNKKEIKNDKKKINLNLNLIDIILTIIRQIYEMKTDNCDSNIKCKYEKMNECNSSSNCSIF